MLKIIPLKILVLQIIIVVGGLGFLFAKKKGLDLPFIRQDAHEQSQITEQIKIATEALQPDTDTVENLDTQTPVDMDTRAIEETTSTEIKLDGSSQTKPLLPSGAKPDAAPTLDKISSVLDNALPKPTPPTPPVIVEKIIGSTPPTPSPTPPPPPVFSEKFALDPAWRNAIVNPYCAIRNSYKIEDATMGSGVIIDPRGVILTNAHVGISFLFAEWPDPSYYDCVIRVGSPAQPLYRAKLLYIPEEYVLADIAQLPKPDDKGYIYGKKDYALLIITGRTNPKEDLPVAFPYLKIAPEINLVKNSFAYILGYPATYLGGITALTNLHMLNSPSTVYGVRSMDGTQDTDIISFHGNVVAQHGSSGGAIIQNGGLLAGMPTFFDKDKVPLYKTETTAESVLNAITTSYVDKEIKKETGLSLSEFIARGNLPDLADQFMSKDGSRYQKMFADALKAMGIFIPGMNI